MGVKLASRHTSGALGDTLMMRLDPLRGQNNISNTTSMFPCDLLAVSLNSLALNKMPKFLGNAITEKPSTKKF